MGCPTRWLVPCGTDRERQRWTRWTRSSANSWWRAYENLDRLDRDLVDLETATDSRALLGSVFRTIHTIKGTSGFLGFSTLEGLTHVGENLLAELRDGKRTMTTATTDVLLRMVDTVRRILETVESTGVEGEHPTQAVIDAIQAVLDGVDPAPSASDEAAEATDLADVTEASDPEAEPAAAPVAAAPKRAVKPVLPAAPKTAAKAQAPAPADAAPEAPAASEAPAEADAPDEMPVRSAAESSIRVDVDVLDALMRHVGELVLARNAMTSLAGDMDDPNLVRASQRLSLIATELQQGVMKTRMQPIDHVWSKVPRMVRDVSSAVGRKVQAHHGGQGHGTRSLRP
nr:Hpt domain-containing protein [Demequina litorisediminis]